MTSASHQDKNISDDTAATDTSASAPQTPDAALSDDVVIDMAEGAADNPAQAQGELAAIKAQLAESNDRLLRALAETDNTRKRLEKERQDTAKYAITGFARELLSVADNLRRALDAIPQEQRDAQPEMNAIYVGVEATERVLLSLFEKHQIKKIEPLGLAFDPNVHEVMFEAEVPGQTPGTVIQVVEPGYMIHDRLLRPARVGVSKGDAAAHDQGGHLDTSA